MSPEKLLTDPVTAPLVVGMLIKVKDFVLTKGTVVVIITAAMAVGVAGYKLEATEAKLITMSANIKEMQGYMLAMQTDMYTMQKHIALTNKDITHIRDDLSKYTAKVDEVMSKIAKIRR